MAEPLKRVLVTDLDNTLWDWFGAWHASFSSMLRVLVYDTGIPQGVLESQLRILHQRYGTVEYSNALSEVPALIEAAGGLEPWRAFPRAVEVLRIERSRQTRLYPGVFETLMRLKQAGIVLIAYTESLSYWTTWRLRRTGLDGVIDVLYSSPDHDLPRGKTFEDMRSLSDDAHQLKITRQRHVPRGVIKPNLQVLVSMLQDDGLAPEEAVYIGDSLMKDVAMAQSAGVTDVHAKYGEAQQRPEYELLRRVTHWTDEDVARERVHLEPRGPVVASHTCHSGFDEVLAVLSQLPRQPVALD